MKQRKKYVIDKKFQIKTTAFILGISSIVVIILLSALSIYITGNNLKLNNIIIIQDNVVETLLTLSQNNQNESVKLSINTAAKNHQNNIRSIKNIINLNTTFVAIILIIAVIQYIILYFVILRKTHKISGPAYVISGYLKEILNGRYPETRPLRKGDELTELHDITVKLIDTMKDKKIILK
ncbi:MAG: hypothetical protein JW864_05630 [Spirochaetes bacterium]|nr:hypothetical protein [Spirochaetota bacterium]